MSSATVPYSTIISFILSNSFLRAQEHPLHTLQELAKIKARVVNKANAVRPSAVQPDWFRRRAKTMVAGAGRGPKVSGTICPYPLTTIHLELVNATTAEECVQTYAAFYGTSYRAIHVISILISATALFVFSYRALILAIRQHRRRKPVRDVLAMWLLLPLIATALFNMLSSIDLWGMNNWIPVAFYLIADRFAIFWLSLVIIELVDFWMRAVGQVLENSSALRQPVKLFLIVLSFASTVLAEVLGIFAVPSAYYLFSGSSYIVFSVVIAALLLYCTSAVYTLFKVLRATELRTSLEGRNSLRRLFRTLLLFLFAGSCGFAYLFVVGVFYLSGIGYTDFRFEMALTLSPSLVAGRVIFWVVLVIALFMFRLPPRGDGSTTAHLTRGQPKPTKPKVVDVLVVGDNGADQPDRKAMDE